MKRKLLVTLCIYYTLIFTSYACAIKRQVSVDKCANKKIKYEIARFGGELKEDIFNFEEVQISNTKDAYYINITGPVQVFCKNTFKIVVRTSHFWCDQESLEEIEAGAFENQNIDGQLSIRQSKIKIIRSDTFKNLPIEELTLTNNQIGVIEERAFVDLPLLTIMDLSGNSITSLHPNAIMDTPTLRSFGIGYNQLKAIGANFFKFMSKSDFVFIGANNNQLSEINPTAFKGLDVYSLGLDNNKLSTIPSEIFKESKNLGELNLENNTITELDNSFFRSRNLFNVFLKGNDFSCNTIRKLKLFGKERDFVNSRRKRRQQPKMLSYDKKNC